MVDICCLTNADVSSFYIYLVLRVLGGHLYEHMRHLHVTKGTPCIPRSYSRLCGCDARKDLCLTDTLVAASKMLRRRIPQSGHLMTAKRFWLQTVPSQVGNRVRSSVPDRFPYFRTAT
jgi:hypothetical protein